MSASVASNSDFGASGGRIGVNYGAGPTSCKPPAKV
jgi:hypothetical protein